MQEKDKPEFDEGPYLSAALICEKVLVEHDNVKSAIRIVDRLTTPDLPIDFDSFLLIRIKSGWARGTYALRIDLVKPSGDSPPPLLQNIHLEGEEDRGIDIVLNSRIRFEVAGIYWFKISLDDKFLTRIPFRVVHIPAVIQRHEPGVGPSPAQNPPTGF